MRNSAGIAIEKIILRLNDWEVFAFKIGPEKIPPKCIALIAHGYTSNKSQQINWATRLAQNGALSILFDWPGHYLGNFNEVKSFSEFQLQAHLLFKSAEEVAGHRELPLVLAGHSMGAILAMKAVPLFPDRRKIAVGVGIGLSRKDGHIFQTPFFEQMLVVRSQLVSDALKPENVFPWLAEERAALKQLSGETIHLISGQDDIVVGKNNCEEFAKMLLMNGNQVTFECPDYLPHHLPELAAPHLVKFVRAQGLL